MKKIILMAFLLIMLVACQNKNAKNQSLNNQNEVKMEANTEKLAVENLLFSYRDALNASDVNQVLALYTKDGVFMPSNAPTSIGTEGVKGAYEFVFSNIQLNIEFSIDEVALLGDYAFARTTSKGTTLIHASGETVPEENRELFILVKEEGQWKIARYMFNKMN